MKRLCTICMSVFLLCVGFSGQIFASEEISVTQESAVSAEDMLEEIETWKWENGEECAKNFLIRGYVLDQHTEDAEGIVMYYEQLAIGYAYKTSDASGESSPTLRLFMDDSWKEVSSVDEFLNDLFKVLYAHSGEGMAFMFRCEFLQEIVHWFESE